jgi:Tfp pilus assembly protein PilE
MADCFCIIKNRRIKMFFYKKKNSSYDQGFTLIELLIAAAVVIILGTIIITALINIFGGVTSTTGPSGTLNPAATQFVWVTKPERFLKNTDTNFTIRLERFNSASTQWDPYGDQDSLVGAVAPDSVTIVSINGDPPANSQPIPQNTSIPGAGGGAIVYTAETNDSGLITFVVKGTEPADGQLSVLYVRSATDVQVKTATFSVVNSLN